MTDTPARDGGRLQLLSIVIPARDEEACIASTIEHLHAELGRHGIDHEIIAVDDGSIDATWKVLQDLAARIRELRPVRNRGLHGFGRAVVCGFEHMRGDAVVVMMADESDAPADVVNYWQTLNQGWDCVFGSRFVRGGKAVDYPRFKRFVNRIVNRMIMVAFRIRLNDTTNAFKAYRRDVIEGCRPFLSPHFNLTVEIPLKAIVRGYSWTTTPISWRNRRTGVAKLKLKEMGSRYLFIVLYVWLEKYFSRGDYRRETVHLPDRTPSASSAEETYAMHDALYRERPLS